MRLFRRMLVNDADRLPVVGGGDMLLGVRVPTDVRPVDGLVHPLRPGGRAQGMSVMAEDWRLMNPRLVPERLGGSALEGEIFETDDGVFAPPLALRPERPPHHVVGPEEPMALGGLQTARAATRPSWRLWW